MPAHSRSPGGPCYVSVAYSHGATDPRVRRHCETLQRRGWRVYQLGLAAEGESRVGRLNGVVLIRRPRARYRGSRLLRYLRAYGGFALWAWGVLRRLGRRRRLDVIQANNIPNAMVGCAIQERLRGAALVLDMHDPVPELFISKFGNRSGARWLVRVLEWEERIASAVADVALCTNERHRELCLRRGIPARKLRIVMNLADQRLFPMEPPREPRPFVMYHGTVAGRMGLEVVLEAISMLRAAAWPLRGAVWGDGDAVPLLHATQQRLGLTEVVEIPGRRFHLHELVPRIREGGVGVVAVRRDPFNDVILPTKLMEYVRLGIPVVVTWTPTVAQYFPDDSVTFVRDFTPLGVAAALKQVLEDPAGARERAMRAQQLPVAQAWQAREGEFAAVIEGLRQARAE